MRFLNGITPTHELTYSDVFLVPGRSAVESRLDVDLRTPDGVGATLPVVVANMTAVAGKRMAETVARRGGLCVLPQDIPVDVITDVIGQVKRCHVVYDTPVTLPPSATVQEALWLLPKRAHDAVIVVDDGRRPVGIFTEHDAVGQDRFTQLHRVMSTHLVMLSAGTPLRELFEVLDGGRVRCAPVVNDDGRLVGALTRKGALRSTLYTPALDVEGRLMVAAAVGINGDVAGRAEQLLAAGADVIVVDTAHGHQDRCVKAVGSVRAAVGPDVRVVAGNVVTADGTLELLDAGADIAKVGVGPGAMCTTRMMTGVGRPQFSAVHECAIAAATRGKHVWADGGVRHPRDVALALAAGAASVMVGSWFAGTHESAADVLRDADGRLYKENFGMASHRAVKGRTRDDSGFERARKELFDEGISTSRMYLQPDQPGVEDILDRISAGVRSACSYAGARTIGEFADRAVVGVQSMAGYEEGRPVGTTW